MRLLFASDFHGNEQHLLALSRQVELLQPEVFIYLGDFSPNRYLYDTPEKTNEYNESVFFPAIEALKVPQKYVMPGNTDFYSLKAFYTAKYNDPKKVQFICEGTKEVWPGIDVLFSSLTKISPHSLKDGETFDLTGVFKQRTTTRIVTEHTSPDELTSTPTDMTGVSEPEPIGRQRAGSLIKCLPIQTSSIAKELLQEHLAIEQRTTVASIHDENLATEGAISHVPQDPEEDKFITADALIYDTRYFSKVDIFKPETQPGWFSKQLSTSLEQYFDQTLQKKKCQIWASHGPVYNTVCDRLRSGDHVGSKGMRRAMFKYKPQLIVSGHIHESARDGQYKQYEQVEDQEVCICTVGNEGLVMPFCLQAAFVLAQFSDNGQLVKVSRVLEQVQKYKDAEEALVKFKETMSRLKEMKSKE